ncbi:protein of unknown function [Burkholderia multivorans]
MGAHRPDHRRQDDHRNDVARKGAVGRMAARRRVDAARLGMSGRGDAALQFDDTACGRDPDCFSTIVHKKSFCATLVTRPDSA